MLPVTLPADSPVLQIHNFSTDDKVHCVKEIGQCLQSRSVKPLIMVFYDNGLPDKSMTLSMPEPHMAYVHSAVIAAYYRDSLLTITTPQKSWDFGQEQLDMAYDLTSVENFTDFTNQLDLQPNVA